MNNIIEFSNVSKSFNKTVILKNVSFKIQAGETIGFVGQNGCGKSVLFKLISGIYRPDNGEIFVNGEKLGEKTDFPKNIGIIIDSPGFIDIYTGFQNLKYLATIQNKIDDETIVEYMKLVGLDPDNKTRVKNYSLGMKQKLAIAQAIMEDQELLLLDEPFNALDEKTHSDILLLIKNLQTKGKTILLTSHNVEDINSVCQRKFKIENNTLREI
ncbi:ABC transporter ATP-binding protein [Eubacterium sp.]|uniref:ABC transporter ATP-binding protein n=1 Tax=Eubacterium sp. TaxID=142586 RepID=UPI0039942A8B